VSLPRATGKGHPELQLSKWLAFLKGKLHGYVVPWSYLRYHRKYVFGAAIAEQIVQLFAHHVLPALAPLVQPCTITDTTDIAHPVSVFNRDLFLASVPARDRPFYEVFAATMVFQAFADSATDETEREVSQMHAASALPDEMRAQFTGDFRESSVGLFEDSSDESESEFEEEDVLDRSDDEGK
jgi:hypothetical protein